MQKLIGFIVVFVIFLTFIILNLENKSDVSLLFTKFTDIPVYLSVFISFGIGMLFAFSITLYNKNDKNKSGSGGSGTSKSRKKPKPVETAETDNTQGQDGSYDID